MADRYVVAYEDPAGLQKTLNCIMKWRNKNPEEFELHQEIPRDDDTVMTDLLVQFAYHSGRLIMLQQEIQTQRVELRKAKAKKSKKKKHAEAEAEAEEEAEKDESEDAKKAKNNAAKSKVRANCLFFIDCSVTLLLRKWGLGVLNFIVFVCVVLVA